MHGSMEIPRCLFILNGFHKWRNISLLLLKIADTLADKVENLTIDGAAFELCYIAEFMMKLRLYFNTQMLVILVPHWITSVNLI